jgi:hypothetical protein
MARTEAEEAARDEAAAHLKSLGIDPGELYDGPATAGPATAGSVTAGNVTQFPAMPPGRIEFVPAPAPVVSRAQYTEAITAALHIVSARLLGMIAVVGAVLMFGWAVYDPQPWRLAAVGTYAAVVLWPIVFLYVKRG